MRYEGSDSLVREPEGKTLEFKRDLSSPRPLLKTLVAFANSAGGRLVLGVSDDRQVIEELPGRLRFTVALKEPFPLTREQSRKGRQIPPEAQSGLESGVESGVESEMASRILGHLREGPLSKAEIARRLGRPKPSRYLNDLMARLLTAGKVAYTIPEKPNSRLQRYRLMGKG